MSNTVYLQINDRATYPKDSFNPAVLYAEYRYGAACVQQKNDIYDMVRECLLGYGLDKEHFGAPDWNPLGSFIKPGQQVLIKPNWVMHFNGCSGEYENSMECLVTHPSCLRAICDYVLIALNGYGKVIIGDAPMQDCNLHVLLERMKYNEILKFYHDHGENVEFMDFRKFQSIFDKNKVIVDRIYQSSEGVNVDFTKQSLHERRKGKRIYQVDNYDRYETEEYHSDRRHIYSVTKDVLESDVIINFCKPKSHRLAGFTAAMKNMVGIAYNKASLPHRVEGSLSEGGDAYKNKSWLKKRIDAILDRKIKHEDKQQIGLATVDRFLYGGLLIIARKVCKDPFIKGIWEGNDTIWRTVIDLNYIEQFADKTGIIKKEKQRRILNFGDMVIAGHHNGPCQPEPKEMGVIIMSENAVAMDLAICKMIGFPENKIPMIKAILEGEADYLIGEIQEESISVISNYLNMNGILSEITFPKLWEFEPHDSWRSIKRS